MTILLTGENDFEISDKVYQYKEAFKGSFERYDGAELSNEKLADIFAGQTLFAAKRLIFIDEPSGNTQLWQNIADWFARLNDDSDVIMIEPKIDKRTAAYKWLKKNAEVHEFFRIDERDIPGLTRWTEKRLTRTNMSLSPPQLRRLLNRTGADQWKIAHSLDKLSTLNVITDEWIDAVVEQGSFQNVFVLFELMLSGNVKGLREAIQPLKLVEDAYKIYGLIASQTLQLAALIHANGDIAKVTSDTGARSSYPFQKMSPYAARLAKKDAKRLIKILADADTTMKTTDDKPWSVVEDALIKMALEDRTI